MYKFFAISLTSMLMLINILGPAQPAMAMDDASTGMSPMMDQGPGEDGSDDILVEEPTVEEPKGKDEPIDKEPEEVTSEDAPEETAKSPPAEEEVPVSDQESGVEKEAPVADEEPVVEGDALVLDEEPIVENQEPVVEEEAPVADEESIVEAQEPVVVDEAPVTNEEPIVEDQPDVQKSQEEKSEGSIEGEDDMVISPNAVDPDPGGCPVDEICDGGGGGEVVEVNATMTAHTGTYWFKTVTYSISDGTTSFDVTSDAYGVGHTKLIKGVTYQVSVTTNEGYASNGAISITPNQANNSYIFELFQVVPEKDSVSFKVLHAYTGQPITGATVTLVHDRTWSHADSGPTNSDGMWASIDLLHGNYVASIELADHHGVYDIPVTVPTNGSIVAYLKPIDYSPISLQFVDDATGEPIPGVNFALAMDKHVNDVEGKSDANGEYTTVPMEEGTYGLWADAEGYGFLNNYQFQHPANGTVVVRMHPVGDGTITFNLIDEDTGDPIPNANITLFDADTTQQAAYGQSNGSGQWITPVLPGGYYNVMIHAPEHYSKDFQVNVLTGNQTLEVPMLLFNDVGNIDFYIVNKHTQVELEGVKISIYKNGLVTTGTTDSGGFWETPQLVGGMYTIVLEKPGFFTKTIEHPRSSVADESILIELTSKKQLDYRVILVLPTYCDPNMNCDDRGQRVIAVPGVAIAGGFSTVLAQTTPETVPMAGATVQLLDPVTGDVLYERVTGEDGQAEFLGIWEGDYTLRITGPSIVEYTAPLSLTESLTVTLPLQPADPQSPENPDDGADPDAGNPDDGTTPDTGNPDEGTTPDTGNPDEGTTPDTGTPDDGTDPDAGNPDEGTTPVTSTPDDGSASGTDGSDDGSTPATDGGESGEASGSNDDNDAAASAGSNDGSIAQSGGNSTDVASRSVDALPNTGTGPVDSQLLTISVMLLSGLGLMGAAIRRLAR